MRHLTDQLPRALCRGRRHRRLALAHVAFAEGICAAEHALGGKQRWIIAVVPRCTFTLPEYAAVGVSEAEAQQKIPSRWPVSLQVSGDGPGLGELEGLVKIIAHAQTDQILGAHIIGPHAADMIPEIAVAMRGGLPSRVIMETIHAHPDLIRGRAGGGPGPARPGHSPTARQSRVLIAHHAQPSSSARSRLRRKSVAGPEPLVFHRPQRALS